MNKKEENNVIDFVSKSQMRRVAKQIGYDGEITNAEFRMAIRALFGPDEIRGHEPE
jgi:hypothetical protein